ncbi:hypothetical protein [Kordiimonas pumila]|uniref:Uncharacterized protein n=1 Tax=Kordiimonas pumila TaxID=2161677 RepID=A0ABV7D2L0_9PROT|nr:hypothetical protein [Kordiimonas pumila]
MFEGYPLLKRVAMGKLVGACFGIAGFFLMPVLWPDTGMMMRVAVLLWYITFGAVISLFALLTYNPVLKLKMPWWFICSFTGAWLDLVLMLFIYGDLTAMLQVWPGDGSVWACPWWFVLEGALVGLAVGFFTHNTSHHVVDETI